MTNLKGKTVFVTGGSRGIGKAIGVRLAQEGANIVIAAKTAEPHPKLEGTIFTAAKEMEEAGGNALPVVMDIRSEDMVEAAVSMAVEEFGGIDILVNNASAINLSGTLQLPMKRYDLMHTVNTRGTFMTSQKCLPHLLKAENPHIMNLSPPLNLDPRWFGSFPAYSIAKYGMSLCVLGMAEEFKGKGVAVNALWPKTTIATAAVNNLLGGDEIMQRSRIPQVMADAAYYIVTKNSRECTGNFFIDEDVLISEGITDLGHYAVNPEKELAPDFFV
ncbi:MAG: NAD(P)-dependent oxidoreductase [Bacteroidetes bacterium]|nr:NAD(P)-dependent oxidoreductase [Bacteroidota bacterium]